MHTHKKFWGLTSESSPHLPTVDRFVVLWDFAIVGTRYLLPLLFLLVDSVHARMAHVITTWTHPRHRSNNPADNCCVLTLSKETVCVGQHKSTHQKGDLFLHYEQPRWETIHMPTTEKKTVVAPRICRLLFETPPIYQTEGMDEYGEPNTSSFLLSPSLVLSRIARISM